MEEVLLGILLAFAFSLGRVAQQINYYKKDCVNLEIKERDEGSFETKF